MQLSFGKTCSLETTRIARVMERRVSRHSRPCACCPSLCGGDLPRAAGRSKLPEQKPAATYYVVRHKTRKIQYWYVPGCETTRLYTSAVPILKIVYSCRYEPAFDDICNYRQLCALACVCVCSHLFWRQSKPFGVCLKFENMAHLGHINLKMMPTLGTLGPQRQVL